jgi:hypothetical protein
MLVFIKLLLTIQIFTYIFNIKKNNHVCKTFWNMPISDIYFYPDHSLTYSELVFLEIPTYTMPTPDAIREICCTVLWYSGILDYSF